MNRFSEVVTCTTSADFIFGYVGSNSLTRACSHVGLTLWGRHLEPKAVIPDEKDAIVDTATALVMAPKECTRVCN